MSQRKRKLIDKQFQLKTTFTIIGVIIIVFFVIIAFSALIATKNSTTIKSSIILLEESIKKNRQQFEQALSGVYNRQKSAVLSSQHTKNQEEIKSGIAVLKNSVKLNFHLISLMIAIIIILGFVLYYYLIRMTHRISGPIYVINQHMQDILNEKEPTFRSLREKDELKDFYKNFTKMVEKLKE